MSPVFQCLSLLRASLFSVGFVALGLVGCASYQPVQVDPKTDLYNTATKLEDSAIRENDTSADLAKYRFVVLNTRSNVYPARFEFFIRTALADLGMVKVLNQEELVSLVKMHPKLASMESINDPLAIKKVSDTLGPVLVIDCNSMWDGDVRRYVTLKITDASSGKTFLRIDHPKFIWASVDPEAHYPVLNALRQWVRATASKNKI
ncbi:MAG: hypothetical protein V4772_26550 [Pseudomonadota bacterium]